MKEYLPKRKERIKVQAIVKLLLTAFCFLSLSQVEAQKINTSASQTITLTLKKVLLVDPDVKPNIEIVSTLINEARSNSINFSEEKRMFAYNNTLSKKILMPTFSNP